MKQAFSQKLQGIAIGASVCVVAGSLAVIVGQAQSQVGGQAMTTVTQTKVIKACVNKKTGVMRMVGKCKKSERKVQWNAAGPAGPQGAQGPQGSNGSNGAPGSPNVVVTDGNGQPVSNVVSAGSRSVTRVVDGRLWYFLTRDGSVEGYDERLYFLGGGCNGTAYSPDQRGPQTTAVVDGVGYGIAGAGVQIAQGTAISVKVSGDQCFNQVAGSTQTVNPLQVVPIPTALQGPLTITAS